MGEHDDSLPVVIVSEAVDSDRIEQLGRLGANGFLRKPLQPDDLLVVLEQALVEGEPVLLPEETEPPTEQEGIESPEGEAAVTPGSGVETIVSSQVQTAPRRRRVRKKKTGGRRLKRIRNYLLSVFLFVLIGILVWILRYAFSAGFLGIGL